ncbi:MAG: DUF6514 family protein [Defluviitaleaceae bacterium]|nr:DUF6514 family protein [Defluviitaleaceae bacterium]
MKKENSITVSKTTIHPEESDPRALEFCIHQLTGYEGEILYGLKVIMRTVDGTLLEEEDTPALTPSLTEIVRLAEMLVKGEVPPSGLLSMIDEYFDLNLPSCVHAARQNNAATSL